MNDLLCPYLHKFVLVFFDAILIYSSSVQDDVSHLTIVLEVLIENQLVANYKKCTFAASTIEYLRHVIATEGVAANPSKIKTMKKWSMPMTIKQLCGFLGLNGYYQKFIAHYGSIAFPLTQ